MYRGRRKMSEQIMAEHIGTERGQKEGRFVNRLTFSTDLFFDKRLHGYDLDSHQKGTV